MFRFKVSHLLMALTLAAFVAIVVRQMLVVRPHSRDEMMVAVFLTGVTALVTGVALGYLLRGDSIATSERRWLLPLVAAVCLANGAAYVIQRETLEWLRHSENTLTPIIIWFFYLDDIKVFTVGTLGAITIMLWGVALRREKLIRWVAAVSLGFWLLVFMAGYMGAAVSLVPLR